MDERTKFPYFDRGALLPSPMHLFRDSICQNWSHAALKLLESKDTHKKDLSLYPSDVDVIDHVWNTLGKRKLYERILRMPPNN
ncbi:hypothetical protein TNCV_4549231 [Trichonephila clavipes]|nr:hypothetical protein TNCV_4549231 [Trichonephila clavipes]